MLHSRNNASLKKDRDKCFDLRERTLMHAELPKCDSNPLSKSVEPSQDSAVDYNMFVFLAMDFRF